jgi:hypothetical protein
MITEQKGPEMDPASASTLADLRDVMEWYVASHYAMEKG